MCGEQFIYAREVVGDQGSPPRVRGTDILTGGLLDIVGITPACAGNRLPSVRPAWAARDHPRVCGEQLGLYSVTMPSAGSPPRVRGTEFPAVLQDSAGRITPACAGNRE